jgi:hypothetical protein
VADELFEHAARLEGLIREQVGHADAPPPAPGRNDDAGA